MTLFFFLKFSFSRPSFISSIFRSLPLFSPSFCSFFHFLFVSFIISRSFSCSCPSFPVLCILCSFLLSRCRLFLSFVHSFPFHGLSSPFIFHLFFLSPFFCLFFLTFLLFFLSLVLPFVLPFRLSFDLFIFHSFILFFSLPTLSFFLTLFLLFFLSYLLLLFLCFDHSLPIKSFIILLPILLVLPFICSFFRPFILLFFRPFIPSPSPFLSFILSFSLLPRAFLCSFIHSFLHSFILSLLDR